MKKIFKILVIIFMVFFTMIGSLYFIFFSGIEFDSKISSSQKIKDLNKKVFWGFTYEKSKKISTDYSVNQIGNDTVRYNFEASLSEKYNCIGQCTINQSTGFGGNSVYIYKVGNRFKVEIDDSYDNVADDNSNKGYKILSQKLILNKENYQINDSIFGKVEIKFRDNKDSSIKESSGFFRGKVQ